MKVIDEVKDNVVSEYVTRKANNEKEKDIIESIWTKYPKLSRNAVKNIILEHKRDEKKNELNINSSEDAVKYIFEENEVVENPEVTRIVEAESEDPKEASVPQDEKAKFKVLKKKVIVDIEGEHATYHVEDGALSFYSNRDVVFSSEEDIEKYRKEQKEYYERCLKNADRRSDEMIEVMNMYK